MRGFANLSRGCLLKSSVHPRQKPSLLWTLEERRRVPEPQGWFLGGGGTIYIYICIGCNLGLYWGYYIGFIPGLYWAYIGAV